jgi:hypothetical protein
MLSPLPTMTSRFDVQFRPGDRAPASKAYVELDPFTWNPVRRLLVARGEVFPATKDQGGFFTPLDALDVGRRLRSATG